MGFDEERGAIRTFKIERIAEAALTPRTFEPPDPAGTTAELRPGLGHHRGPGADEVVLRFTPAVAAAGHARRAGTRPRRRSRSRTARSVWRATVAGPIEIRLWVLSWGDDVEVLEPVALRDDVAATHARAAGALRDRTVKRHQFAAVNLISDPIHGYVELTKRLTREESAATGLPDEDVAEQDLLDTAWLQRLRRISQLQSARWVFPTAEHSRFTHGLGVMHEAGLWARALYPSLRGELVRGWRARPVGGPRRRDPADGRPPPRRRPRAVRPLLRRPGPRRLPGPRRPAATRWQAPDPRGPVGADHRGRARRAPARPAPGAG